MITFDIYDYLIFGIMLQQNAWLTKAFNQQKSRPFIADRNIVAESLEGILQLLYVRHAIAI